MKPNHLRSPSFALRRAGLLGGVVLLAVLHPSLAAHLRAEDTPEAPDAPEANPGVPTPLRGVYDKPFLDDLWRKARAGGYTEFELHNFENDILGISEGFRMRRTNLFFFTDIADSVRFGSEIEFETEFEGVPSSEIEVAVEMAFVDWILFEELKLRGGAILPPLGRINVNHDGPVRELTDRPLVSTFVIPTTLTEAGVGAHGTVGIADWLTLRYEAYAVNGFNLLDENGGLASDITQREQLLRAGRTSIGGDINSGLASTGRVSFEIAKRFELGGSWHAGTYDEDGDNLLAITALDAAWSGELHLTDSGPLALGLEGEIAVSDFERNSFARAAGVPDRFWGFYVQGTAGGMPDILRSAAPNVFGGEGSSLGVVLRYDWIDLDGDKSDAIEPGITFRPVSDTVFKFSYKFTQRSLGIRGLPGREHFDDKGFVFSISSYF